MYAFANYADSLKRCIPSGNAVKFLDGFILFNSILFHWLRFFLKEFKAKNLFLGITGVEGMLILENPT